MRGEGVAQRVRTHPLGEPGALGIALHDLVEALPREPGPALVDEHMWLLAISHKSRACSVEVGAKALDRLAADRHDPLFGALSACSQDAAVEVEVSELEADGF